MKPMVDPKRSYQEASLCGATPIELVVALYDTAIGDMRRALAAMQGNDVETRTQRISHALIILQQLQGTLDFERGGAAARQFEQFYNLVRGKLLEAQIRGSAELLGQQISYFSEVRECWVQVKHLVPPVGGPTLSARLDRRGAQSQKSGWSA